MSALEILWMASVPGNGSVAMKRVSSLIWKKRVKPTTPRKIATRIRALKPNVMRLAMVQFFMLRA